jgi:pimeloyl-ACP methyl ester carboxylesterase
MAAIAANLPQCKIPECLSDVAGVLERLPPDKPEKIARARGRRFAGDILPKLTGSYSNIGYARKTLKLPGAANVDVEVGIEIFAPTHHSSGNRLPLSGYDGLFMDVLSPQQKETLFTHATDRLTPVKPLPTILFSPGAFVEPSEYRHLLEEFASHGFTVLAVRHPSNYPRETPGEDEHRWNQMAEMEANNLRCIVDQIRQGNFLNDLIIPNQIILAGHSIGGAASVLAARADPLIAGCINVDGALTGDKKGEGVQASALTILADHLKHAETEAEQQMFEKYNRDWQSFHARSKHSHLVQVPDIAHMDFCLSSIVHGLVGEETLDTGLKAHEGVVQAVSPFLRGLKEASQS